MNACWWLKMIKESWLERKKMWDRTGSSLTYLIRYFFIFSNNEWKKYKLWKSTVVLDTSALFPILKWIDDHYFQMRRKLQYTVLTSKTRWSTYSIVCQQFIFTDFTEEGMHNNLNVAHDDYHTLWIPTWRNLIANESQRQIQKSGT